jgi:hypothetical protein
MTAEVVEAEPAETSSLEGARPSRPELAHRFSVAMEDQQAIKAPGREPALDHVAQRALER